MEGTGLRVRAPRVQEVPRVDAMAERTVAGFFPTIQIIWTFQVTRALRAAFVCLEGVDLIVMLKTRAHVMKSLPKFLIA